MKRFKLSMFIIVFFAVDGYSQKLHTPAEITKMMVDSKLSYTLEILDTPTPCKDLSGKLNPHDKYRMVTESGIATYSFRIKDEAKPLFDKAENYFTQKNSDSALAYYKLAIIADSNLYIAMTYIGQIYGAKGDYDNAIMWYKKAISRNYIDYMAHWFLADSYLATDNLKDAVDEIVIAQILNRNNPRIKESMVNIFKKDGRNTDDWCFNPQMIIEKTDENKIRVAANAEWVVYAMMKAFWAYDPGYSESMGVAKGSYSSLEDKECLLPILLAMENEKKDSKAEYKADYSGAQFRMLKEATNNKNIDDYIFYEILLPNNPFVAFQLPENIILGIKDYVLNIRHKK